MLLLGGPVAVSPDGGYLSAVLAAQWVGPDGCQDAAVAFGVHLGVVHLQGQWGADLVLQQRHIPDQRGGPGIQERKKEEEEGSQLKNHKGSFGFGSEDQRVRAQGSLEKGGWGAASEESLRTMLCGKSRKHTDWCGGACL